METLTKNLKRWGWVGLGDIARSPARKSPSKKPASRLGPRATVLLNTFDHVYHVHARTVVLNTFQPSKDPSTGCAGGMAPPTSTRILLG